jgi:O-antigen/teichoic acid export membrane protein
VSEYLQGKEEFLLPSLSSSAQRLTVAGVGLAVLLVRPELIAVAIVFVVGAAVNIAVLLVGLRKRGWVRPQADVAVSFRLFRSAIPLGLYWILAIFYFNVDMVLLERLAPAENVGWYAAAYRLFNMAAIVPTIVVGIVLYPVLARLSLGARGELRIVIEKALTFLTVAGVAAALVLMLFAEPIVALLYPSEAYRAAANALRLLAPGVLFQYLNWVLACALLGLHREKRMLVIAAGAAILNLIANLVAIPLFREDGAALTTSLTELALLGCLLWSMPKDLLSLENVRVVMKAGFAAGLAALVVRAVGEQPLFLALPLALLVYGAAALALRVVPPRDLRTLLALRRARTPRAATAPVPIREEVA